MERREADVCVVGAGFAGLAAARALINEGKTVVLLEARDRVGGRVWDKTLEDGTVVSVGGTWIGRGHDRLVALVDEVGMKRYPQYEGDSADSIYQYDGDNHRYQGMFVPIGLEGLASLGLAFEALNELKETVPADRPWETPGAHTLDAQSLGEWIASAKDVTEHARQMLRTSLGMLFSSDPSEVSLLGSMLLARGGGDVGFQYYADASYTETHLVEDGGVPEVARRLGDALGDSLRKSTPVRRIRQHDDHVEVFGDDVIVRAKYVIVTAPPNVAGQIEFDPPLPAAHGQLLRKMPAGAIMRFIAVYDTPFWRAKGLSGFSVAPQSQFPVTIDQCPNGPDPKGVLSSYVIGANAVQFALLTPEERKEICLTEIASRLGDEALEPVAFSETDWSTEHWTQGGMIGHFPPGVLTSYGHVLHEPAGRVSFAGTERATAMHGLIEGAIRSGEKAAGDVMEKLA